MPPENYEPGQKSRASVKHDIYRYQGCFSIVRNVGLRSQMFQLHFIWDFLLITYREIKLEATMVDIFQIKRFALSDFSIV